MSDDGINFNINPKPLISARDWAGTGENRRDNKYDCWVIDPRVTKIDDTYYIVRPAQCADMGPAAVIEKTRDFESVEFVECVALPSNRVPCLFPVKINGMYMRIDRPYNLVSVDNNLGGHKLDDTFVSRMWLSSSPDMIFWGKHRLLFFPPLSFANYKVGPTPPIKTKDGWLEIIHGVYKENRGHMKSEQTNQMSFFLAVQLLMRNRTESVFIMERLMNVSVWQLEVLAS